MPVPAGSGMPGSIARRPRPAWALWAWWLRVRWKSLHEQLLAMSAHLHVGGGGDQHPQRVLTDRPVGALLPRCDFQVFQTAPGEFAERLERFGREVGVGPVGERGFQGRSWFLGRAVGRLTFARPRVDVALVGREAGQFPARL